MEDGTTFVCEASNTYGRDQYHVSVELGGIRKLFYLLRSIITTQVMKDGDT